MLINFFYLALRHYERGCCIVSFFLVISSDLVLSELKSTFHFLAQNLMLLRSVFNSAAARSILQTNL